MSHHWSRLTALAGLTAFAACAGPSQPAVDLTAEGQAVRAASMAMVTAVQAKDYAKFAAFFAPDGIRFSTQRGPLVGPAAIQAHYDTAVAKIPSASMSWTTERVMVAASGDMAVEVGSWVFSNEGKQLDRGKYVTTWRKLDGAWRVSTDMSASTVPEQTESLAVRKPATNQ